jgi:hypothetical protein
LVPPETLALKMSPVEICGTEKRSAMKPAWVPLPAPRRTYQNESH